MRRALLVLVLICAGAMASAQDGGADGAAIRGVMKAQSDAWNRGDIPGFMQGYDHSPETAFLGATLGKGYEKILKRYQANYSTMAQMGTVSFFNIDVRLLPDSCGTVEYAVGTGNYHLDRTQKGATAKDDGRFSLVWHKGPQGWKIVLDHTS